MSKRVKQWAIKRKAEQLRLLGGECIGCGSKENLERDCIIPQGDQHHKMSTCQRTSFYNAQMKLGNVQLLCPKCHTKKTVIDTAMTPEERAAARNRRQMLEISRRLAISNAA